MPCSHHFTNPGCTGDAHCPACNRTFRGAELAGVPGNVCEAASNSSDANTDILIAISGCEAIGAACGPRNIVSIALPLEAQRGVALG
jgi:hypothetical protein